MTDKKQKRQLSISAYYLQAVARNLTFAHNSTTAMRTTRNIKYRL